MKALLKDMDEEGLKFLIQQAGVILHNLQAAKSNEEIIKLKAMDKMESKAHRPDKSTVAVEEAEDGSHFILTVNKGRKDPVLRAVYSAIISEYKVKKA